MNKQASHAFALTYTKKLGFFAFALGLYYLCHIVYKEIYHENSTYRLWKDGQNHRTNCP